MQQKTSIGRVQKNKENKVNPWLLGSLAIGGGLLGSYGAYRFGSLYKYNRALDKAREKGYKPIVGKYVQK